MSFRDQIIRHEGLSLKPYLDSEGHLTIGVGRLLERGISHDEAMLMLENDILTHADELAKAFPIVRELDQARYEVLLNMAFNLGIPKLSTFKRMWAAIEAENWLAASLEMLDSLWARQVGSRATELAEIMRNG